jgi:GNAT superfamily N-acetyltransferase
VTLSYPRDEEALLASWDEADAIFVGCVLDEVIAYVALELRRFRATARVSDLVVARGLRRKGIGSRMLLAGEAWAHDRGAYRILTELQIRNDPAIKMMLKLGYQLCGYVDQYFPNQEMALFFEKRV